MKVNIKYLESTIGSDCSIILRGITKYGFGDGFYFAHKVKGWNPTNVADKMLAEIEAGIRSKGITEELTFLYDGHEDRSFLINRCRGLMMTLNRQAKINNNNFF